MMPNPHDPQSIGWIVMSLFAIAIGTNAIRQLFKTEKVDPDNEPVGRRQWEAYIREATQARDEMRQQIIRLQIQAARLTDSVSRIEHRVVKDDEHE